MKRVGHKPMSYMAVCMLATLLLSGLMYSLAPQLGLAGPSRGLLTMLTGGIFGLLSAGLGWWVLRMTNQERSGARAGQREKVSPSDPSRSVDEQCWADAMLEAFSARPPHGRTLPLIALIGSSGGGKTTLLQASGLPLTALSSSRAGNGDKPCAWWRGEDALFVDIPESYLLGTPDNSHWRGFLQVLRRQHPFRPFGGVILLLGLDELVGLPDDALIDRASQLRGHLDELALQLETWVPVFLVLSQADRLRGLVELAKGLARGDRQQALGVDLDILKDGSARFSEHYHQLLARLEAQIQWAHAEPRAAEVTESMQGLSGDMADLEGRLQALVDILGRPGRSCEPPRLMGLYLVSSIQEGGLIRGRREVFLESVGLPAVIPGQVAQLGGAIFARGAIQKVIEHATAPPLATLAARQRRIRQGRLVSAGLAIALFSSAFGLTLKTDGALSWVRATQQASQLVLHSAGGIQTGRDARLIRLELERSLNLLKLVENPPEQILTRRLSQAGARALSWRVGWVWMDPLVPVLAQQLVTGAQEASQGGAPFVQAFRALQATRILEKGSCPGVGEAESQAAVADYLTALWEASWAEPVPQHPGGEVGGLSRLLTHYLSQAASPRDGMGGTAGMAALSAMQRAVPSEAAYALELSLSGLSRRLPQLESRWLSEEGLPTAYTPQGCRAFFRNARVSEDWWSCLLGKPAPSRGERETQYIAQSSRARQEWVRKVGWKQSLGQLSQLLELLQALARPQHSPLDEILAAMGAETLEEKATRLAGEATGTSSHASLGARATRALGWGERASGWAGADAAVKVCEASREPFRYYRDALTADKSPPFQAIAQYKVAASALRSRLAKTLVPAGDALLEELVLETLFGKGELLALSDARETLRSAFESGGQAVDFSPLDTLLRGLEQQAWQLLTHRSALATEERWTLLYRRWERARWDPARDLSVEAEACKRIQAFIEKDIGGFSSQYLSPYFKGRDLRAGLESAFGVAPELDPSAAWELDVALEEARDWQCATTVPDTDAAQLALAPSGGTAIKPKQLRLAVTANCQEAPVVSIELDDGQLVTTCNWSTGRCSESRQPSLGQSQTVVQRAGRAPFRIQGDVADLLEHGLKPPWPDCPGILLKLEGGARSKPVTSGGGRGSPRFKGLELPRTLLRPAPRVPTLEEREPK